MEDKKTTSAWDELAKDLGADPTPESFQRQERNTEPLDSDLESAESAESAEEHDVPQAEPSDWAGLADTLGVPTAPDPDPYSTSEAESATKKLESLNSESLAQEDSEIQFEEELPYRADSTDENAPVEESLAKGGPLIPPSDDAQNAFDALFLSGAAAAEVCGKLSSPDEPGASEGVADGEETGEEKKRRRPRRRRGRGKGRRNQGDQLEAAEDAVEEAAAVKEAALSDLDPFDDVLSTFPSGKEDSTEDGESEQASDDADDSDGSKKGQRQRRPRRRRRARGRGPATDNKENGDAEANDDAEYPTTTADDGMEMSEDAGEDSSEDLSTDIDDDDSDSSTSEAGKRPSHRNIPTWKEAMSVIVDTNLEARKKAPAKAGKSSSPRGRGRSRGGRSGKKS